MHASPPASPCPHGAWYMQWDQSGAAGGDGEDEMLASCYRRSFELAADVNAASIAFPAISTGTYGFPKQRAASIAVREMHAFESRFERVVACCFSEGGASFYRPLPS